MGSIFSHKIKSTQPHEMTTIDRLKEEIQALQKIVVESETQLTTLQFDEGMNAEIKLMMIKILGDRILKNQKLITAKEIEKDKLITITKQVDATKEIEKEKQNTIDKQYRLDRGETNAASILYIYFHS